MNLKLKQALIAFSVLLVTLVVACTKNPNPPGPIHDTLTVIKKDTIVKKDTLYATLPDSIVDLKKGLLVYLPFAGNTADSSGNNNPTTVVGGPVLTIDRNGYTDNAFLATGAGQEVLVTNNGSIKLDTAFTLSLVFMLNSYGSQTFASLVNNVNGYGPTFNVGIGTTLVGGQNLDLGLADASSGCDNDGSANPKKILLTTNFVPQLHVWYNVIYAYQRGTIKVFVNGTLISTKTGSGSLALLCPTAQLIVGAWWNGDKQGINGKLDNIRLYNRILTAKELITLSQNYLINANSVKPGLQSN